jgi:hypothetical protein
MYLLSTVALYLTVLSGITLLFQYINAGFPDPVSPNYGLAGQVRWFVAMLIVVFPVFLWTARTLRKERDAVPEKGEIKVRKWLVYLTIFLSAILMIGDLVAVVYNFLDGELSARFYLKALVVLVVAGGVFGYYYYDLRRKAGESAAKLNMFSWIASLAVLAIAVGAFFVVGSPSTQRNIRFDEQRLGSIQNLTYAVEQYYAAKEALPSSLNDLNVLGGGYPMKDPETSALYEYRKTGDLSYELCANFALSSQEIEKYEHSYERIFPAGGDWSHGVGRSCFARTIDPDILNQRYPGTKPMPMPVLN